MNARSDETRILIEFSAERARAHEKHGATSAEAQPALDHRRMSILTEEVGEAAKVLNNRDHGLFADDVAARAALREELIQVGAMALAGVAAIDREESA